MCSEGRAARITRPLDEANAGVRLPTWVTSRTGWDVSSIATYTESSPSSAPRQTVSSWRVRSSAAMLRNATTIGSWEVREPIASACTPSS